VHGVPLTVLAAVIGELMCIRTAGELSPKGGTELLLEHSIQYWRGIAMEIYWREIGKCPSEEEYIGISTLKWHYVLQRITRMLQLLANDHKDLSSVVTSYGIFQAVYNDFTDIIYNPYEGKSFCDDITEGKFNFMAVHAIDTMKNQEAYGW
jgi:geranylgeranyl diphosphate synthase, type III